METKKLTTEEKEINVIDLLLGLVRHKRFIMGGTFAFALLTVAVCFIVSPVFTATTTILPPQQSSSALPTQLLSQLGGTASALLGASLPSTSGDLFVGLLTDRSILDPVIDRFDLINLYRLDTRVETQKVVAEDILRVEKDSKSGIVSISVDDKDPQRAADMANMFAEELKKVLETLTVSEAGVRRMFFERELKKAHEELSRTEEAMQGFQESSGALKIDDQAMAVLQGVAALRANIVAKEVQLQVMKTYAAANNPDLKKGEEELNALHGQQRKLEDKESIYTASPLMPTGQIPTIGLEYIRKMRDFRYKEAVYQVVAQQYQTARLDEAREALVVQVIQKAVPPDKKAKPRMTLLVALSIVGGGGLFTMAAVGKEILEKASEHPENQGRFHELKRNLLRI